LRLRKKKDLSRVAIRFTKKISGRKNKKMSWDIWLWQGEAMFIQAEYLWIDGAHPTKQVRSKTRILRMPTDQKINIEFFPEWNYDGSSTYQAPGNRSDMILKPVNMVRDPLRKNNNFLVMCEVFDADGRPDKTNSRAELRREMDEGGNRLEPWLGFEQEYTLFKNSRPLGWPLEGFPEPQGPFYCGVGQGRVVGRKIIEEHTQACIDAGIMIYGTNAEVLFGQWEFQVGYRGSHDESADPLNICDHLWFARFLLHRIAEDHEVVVSLDNKPVLGDWNGSGNHTNISTKETRDKTIGWQWITKIVEAFSKTHDAHIAVYGHGLEKRLTGHHETCDINTFRMGERDRGASIRIPDSTAQNRCGYIEDRRPGANCNPYQVATQIMKTLKIAYK
jgi:glutamine synthetase